MVGWSVRRAFFKASNQDIKTAALEMKTALENVSGKKFKLSVVFYGAVVKQPPAVDTHKPLPPWLGEHKTAHVIHHGDSIDDIASKLWRKADYIRIDYTTDTPDNTGKPVTASLEARGWDHREIKFRVSPDNTGFDVMRRFSYGHFLFWAKTLDTPRLKDYPFG